jgi:autotransporter-associated beta strand protein
VSGFVYTGQGVWNTGSGSWSTFANWQQAGGTPGLDGALSANDTATFGTGGSGTIALNGASPTISSLTFSNASASYVVAQGTGGSLSLFAGSNNATVNNNAGSHSFSAPLVLGSDVTFYGASDSLLSVSGVVSGSGALIQSGTGTLALTGVNNYSGGTLVSGGTLTGNASGIQGSVTNNATVVFNQSSAGIYSGNMSGIGALVVSGNGGALTLSGNNSYTGGTLVNSGASVIGNTASLTGDIANNGALTFHNGSIGSFDGVISGTGSLAVSGSAAVTLNAASIFTGITEISNGATLALGASGSLLNSSEIKLGTLQQPGTLDLTSKASYVIGAGQTLSGSGTVSMASGGTINLNGTVTPGFTSPGIQSFNGNALFGNSATTTMVLDGGSNGTTSNSSVNATGSITYAGGLLIQTTSSFWSLPGATYQLSLFSAGVTQSGLLSSINLSGTFSGSFTYNSGTSNWLLKDSGDHYWDFNQANGLLTVTVPEPSTYALMAIGAGIILITVIRRRRANS